ncbi:helix-hairpin-helix domain-containing protein [Lachnospiraceae bacterium ZAX-1]
MIKYRTKALRKLWSVFLLLSIVLYAGCNNQAHFYTREEEGELVAQSNAIESDQDKTFAANTSKSSEGDKGQGKNREDTESQDKEEDLDRKEKAKEESQIYVQICGAVKSPGVYALVEGSRIFKAVELAGGLLEEADITSVNQAEILDDGQMVYICAIGEETNIALKQEQGKQDTKNSGQEQDSYVNINTATQDLLLTLPGVGKAKADSIMAFREANGAFSSIEDLMKIEGIKDGVFSKLKDKITVD